MKRALIRSPSRVERREGNCEFGEYKVNIYGSKDTYEYSKISYRHEENMWRILQLLGKKLVIGYKKYLGKYSLIGSLYKKRPSGVLDREVPSRGVANTT